MLTGFYWDNGIARLVRNMDSAQRGIEEIFFTPAQTAPWPPLNVYGGADNCVITAELPGVEPEKVEVTLTGDLLTIKGNRATDPEDGEVYWRRRERRHGEFERGLKLPFNGRPEDVRARLENGVLTVTVQKPAEIKPVTIKISNG